MQSKPSLSDTKRLKLGKEKLTVQHSVAGNENDKEINTIIPSLTDCPLCNA